MQPSYESHIFKNPNYPVIFHTDYRPKGYNDFPIHWHESVELLYFFMGGATVVSDGGHLQPTAGDLVIINSNHIHAVYSPQSACHYHCLIVDREFCESFGVKVSELTFCGLVRDPIIGAAFDAIKEETHRGQPYYMAAVKAEIIKLFVYLCRYYTKKGDPAQPAGGKRQLSMVKDALHFIGEHFCETLTISAVCEHLGFSKYYFCHTFKEVTGQTLVEYINFLRCSHARMLLSSGKYTVAESAEKSGFKSPSYFSMQYKRYMGTLPSVDLKSRAQEG